MSAKVNHGVICDGCGAVDFPGDRYKCRVCENYDLCENCMDKGITNKGHLSDHEVSKMSSGEDKGAVIDMKSIKEFDSIIQSDKLIIVDFHATWYAAAVSFQPKLAEISLQYPTITFIRIDIDQFQDVSNRFSLAGPAIFFFRRGEAIRQLSGISTWGNPKELEEIIHHELSTLGFKAVPVKSDNKAQKTEKSSSAPAVPKRFPQREPLLWTVGKFEQILNKVFEFSAKVPEQGLDNKEEQVLKEITNKLSNKDSQWSEQEFKVIEKIVSWPSEFRFPALDIFRFFVLSPNAAAFYAKNSQIFGKVLGNLSETGPDANKLMALRVIANMFKNPSLELTALSFFNNALGAMGPLVVSQNRNIQVSVATVLLNFAVVLCPEDERTKKLQLMDAMSRSLGVIGDEEGAYRLIVGIGTFLSSDRSLGEGFSIDVERFLTSENTNLKESAQELKLYLR